MLITNAELYQVGHGAARVEGAFVTGIGDLQARPGERVLDADGGALLPGLHDHHLHLRSYAAALGSTQCGPPQVNDAEQLRAALGAAAAQTGGWIRGVGYHDSVAGSLDRVWLDAVVPTHPVRVQHRSGRMWIVNSSALQALRQVSPSTTALPADGRLYEADPLLHLLPDATAPDLAMASQRLASYGVTGCTDMTPHNNAQTMAEFRADQREHVLLQHVRMAGRLEWGEPPSNDAAAPGPTKIHLHEAALPAFPDLCTTITASHAAGRPVAVHCVTETELVFTLAALREVGPIAADRIEHASVATDELINQISKLGITVVTQPNFLAERGDAYLREVPSVDQPGLYRCAGFIARGVPLAAGTDAPFGHADPWRAMAAAVQRRSAAGVVMNEAECLTPEQALALFLGPLERPAEPRRLVAGMVADLCLLDRPWAEVRAELSSDRVRTTLRSGAVI